MPAPIIGIWQWGDSSAGAAPPAAPAPTLVPRHVRFPASGGALTVTRMLAWLTFLWGVLRGH